MEQAPKHASTVQQSRSRRWIKWICIGFASILILFGFVLLGIWWYHPRFIYHPNSYAGRDESTIMQPYKPTKIAFYSKDGTRLRGYWFPHTNATSKSTKKVATLLYFHGNDGYIEDAFNAIAGWQRHLPLNVFYFNYRGYGFSDRKRPSMKGIRQDAQAALDLLLERPGVDPKQIVVYGHSLGGAVALHVARDNLQHIRMLFLENTFLSIRKMASHRAPYLAWASFVVTERWDNERMMREIASSKGKVPAMLFMVGEKDDVVPPSHMQNLYDEARSGLKGRATVEKVSFADCRHTCFPVAHYYTNISTYYTRQSTKQAAK